MKATVISVSENTNAFGYKSVIALTEEGKGVQLLIQVYGTDAVPIRGEDIDVNEDRFHNRYYLPDLLTSYSKHVIAKARASYLAVTHKKGE